MHELSTNLLHSDVQRGCRSADLELKLAHINLAASYSGASENCYIDMFGKGRRVSMSRAGKMEHKLCNTESACTQC